MNETQRAASARLLAWLTLVLGIGGMSGFVPAFRLFAALSADWPVMPLRVGVVMVVLAVVMLYALRRSRGGEAWITLSAGAAGCALLGALDMIGKVGESTLHPDMMLLHGLGDAVEGLRQTSRATGLLVVLASAGTALSAWQGGLHGADPARVQAVSALGGLVAGGGLLAAAGMAAGIGLFASAEHPVAVTTGLALAALGGAQLLAAGLAEPPTAAPPGTGTG